MEPQTKRKIASYLEAALLGAVAGSKTEHGDQLAGGMLEGAVPGMKAKRKRDLLDEAFSQPEIANRPDAALLRQTAEDEEGSLEPAKLMSEEDRAIMGNWVELKKAALAKKTSDNTKIPSADGFRQYGMAKNGLIALNSMWERIKTAPNIATMQAQMGMPVGDARYIAFLRQRISDFQQRKLSGAAISAQEMENYIKMLPNFKDLPQDIVDKMRFLATEFTNDTRLYEKSYPILTEVDFAKPGDFAKEYSLPGAGGPSNAKPVEPSSSGGVDKSSITTPSGSKIPIRRKGG
jgi:hypothetical protein